MPEVRLGNVQKVAGWAVLGCSALAGWAFVSVVSSVGLGRTCPGLGPEPVQPTSKAVPGGGFVRLGSGGVESCAQTRAGELWCWGHGQGLVRRQQPSPLGAQVAFEQLAVNELGFCATDAAHVARCERRLPSGAADATGAELMPWFELPDTRRVVLGARHGCALGDDGSVWCFGYNDAGQLPGLMPATWSGAAVRVLGGVQDVSVGAKHTCAVLRSGQVRCWGDNSSGQIGAGATGLVELPGLARQVALGDSHSCALLVDGSVYCWGQDLVDGDSKLRGPRAVPLEAPASSLASSGHTACVELAPDRISCWGQSYGCAGGDYYCAMHDRTTPRRLDVPGEVAALTLGDGHACVLLRSGNVACVGSNREHQLGSVLPYAPVTHYAFHALDCNDEVWEQPPGWPQLLPLIW